MDKVQYRNRYGDIFTFSKTEDGDLLWEGNFEFCRYGWPNVYDDAFKTYNEDGGDMSLEEFVTEIFKAEYDSEGKYLGMSEVNKLYSHLIYSDRNTIDICDPSGGPYLCANTDMGIFDKSLEGMIVDKFEEGSKTSWKIIIKK